MPKRHWVRLTKDHLVFSAGHFITFGGNICERIHGHNYRVEVELHGPLDENHYVVDFIALRDSLQAIVNGLDHRMLLPTKHPSIRVHLDEKEVTASFEDRRWVFPREECILLDIPNTTTELLAEWIGERLLEALDERLRWKPEAMKVGVDENHGQWGYCEFS
ncbi:6-pyruvoyl tetrahydropterin synthase family protein [Bremerella cremea]|uniref:6-carboxy-5,6,7,8-tetrahydropterin synthase n=1 Tax=Blastopirellula marina TaxID=124 RepID=A0A2S8FYM1_9BACT|nr:MULTISPECIES: 6-pyruvoyl tetrahydropterin synthase family protein [Pirellulaceae]PQO37282.1 6-pyruvoyl tetrahydrobiopterin synthase [Blastopirellula marina]RCS49669.1 6-pyruvoyl tetrahydropterin synthase family protein [Bremerella cremea]